jgi:CRP-like cAMP-binding protein
VDDSALGTKALQSTPFFAGLAEEDLRNVLAIGQSISFQPGDAIIQRGELGDAMFIVLGGKAQVDVGGRYHDLGPGDFFGEMALITAKKRMATVRAAEPVVVLRIPADDFQSFLLQNATVAMAMLKALVERLREVEERIDAWMGSG